MKSNPASTNSSRIRNEPASSNVQPRTHCRRGRAAPSGSAIAPICVSASQDYSAEPPPCPVSPSRNCSADGRDGPWGRWKVNGCSRVADGIHCSRHVLDRPVRPVHAGRFGGEGPRHAAGHRSSISPVIEQDSWASQPTTGATNSGASADMRGVQALGHACDRAGKDDIADFTPSRRPRAQRHWKVR